MGCTPQFRADRVHIPHPRLLLRPQAAWLPFFSSGSGDEDELGLPPSQLTQLVRLLLPGADEAQAAHTAAMLCPVNAERPLWSRADVAMAAE